MGGRGTTGKTKLFTNIDAARNAPLRAARAKEIESEQAAQNKTASKTTRKSKSTIAQKFMNIHENSLPLKGNIRKEVTNAKAFENAAVRQFSDGSVIYLHSTKGRFYTAPDLTTAVRRHRESIGRDFVEQD